MQVNLLQQLFFHCKLHGRIPFKKYERKRKGNDTAKVGKKKRFLQPTNFQVFGVRLYRNTTQSSLIALLHLIPDACFGFLPWVQGQTNGAFDRLLHLHVPK